MGRACCVLGCTSGGDAPSHQIPKNPDLFKKWKNMIYSKKIEHLTDEQISKLTVCFRHFADEDYLVTYRVRKLKRGVAPSLNLPNEAVQENVEIKSNTSKNISSETALIAKEIKEEGDISSETALRAKEIKEGDTIVVRLFEDLPETLESHLLKQSSVPEETSEESCQQPDTNTEYVDLISDVSKINFRDRTLRRKRVRLTEKQSLLLRRKRQAEKYTKTSTIQKLLSFVTATEKSSLQNRIQRSKYSPRIYVRLYHDIAKRKAFGI